jgi:hypothetical protein
MSCCVSRRRVGLEVGQELSVDGIGDPPLQTPQGFPGGLALALLACQIGVAGMVAAGLGDGHDLQVPVQPAVAAAVQPMPLDAARGGRDRGSAVGRGELVPVSKATHVTHLTKDPRGDQWADAMDLDQ